MEADLAKESLIAEITTAFDGVSREEGTTLHEAEMIDCHGSKEELTAARLQDIESRWQDVPDEWIEEFSSAYCFMDAKGFRYYLPAVMIWSLRGGRSDSATSDNVVDLLLKRYSFNLRDSLIPILSTRQRQATAQWLLYSAAHSPYQPERHIAELKESVWAAYLRDNLSSPSKDVGDIP